MYSLSVIHIPHLSWKIRVWTVTKNDLLDFDRGSIETDISFINELNNVASWDPQTESSTGQKGITRVNYERVDYEKFTLDC